MASSKPQDLGAVVVPRALAAEVERISANVGLWTVNGTKSTIVHIFDRPGVIREVWFGADAVPSDPDGTMLVSVEVQDVSEGALDPIVTDFDAETIIVAAKKGYQGVLAAEGTENERTVQAGDVLQVRQVNNSAAITTNPNLLVTVLFQTLENVAS
jgi:hypothetical protein